MNRVKVKDLGKVITGKTPPSINPEYFGGSIPFLTPTDMNYMRRVNTERTISEAGRDKYRQNLLPPGSTAFVCIGATIGKISQVATPTLTNQQINSVVPNDNADPDYVYYALLYNRNKVIQVAGGAATPIVNKTVFENIEIEIHDPQDQKKISGILSAYDDLIENNRKRIEKMEAMTELLYRKYIMSCEEELTEISIAELGKVITGKTPSKAKSSYYSQEGMMFIKTPDMHKGLYVIDTVEKLSSDGYSSQSNKTLPSNTICLSCIGTVGIVSITATPSQTNQQINAIILNDLRYLEYLVIRLRKSRQLLENLGSNGATMTNISKSKIENLLVPVPTSRVISEFHNSVAPIFNLILNLQKRNRGLSKSRDKLLNKLMSSEVKA